MSLDTLIYHLIGHGGGEVKKVISRETALRSLD